MDKSVMTMMEELIDKIKINGSGTKASYKKKPTRTRSSSSLVNTQEKSPSSSSKRTGRVEAMANTHEKIPSSSSKRTGRVEAMVNTNEKNPPSFSKRTGRVEAMGIARSESTQKLLTHNGNNHTQTKITHSRISRCSGGCLNTDSPRKNSKKEPSKKNIHRSKIPTRIKAEEPNFTVDEIIKVIDKLLEIVRQISSKTCRGSSIRQNNLLQLPSEEYQEMHTTNQKKENLNETYISRRTPSRAKTTSKYNSTMLKNDETPSKSPYEAMHVSNETGLGESVQNSKRTDQRTPQLDCEKQISRRKVVNSLKKNYDSGGSTPSSYTPMKYCKDVNDKSTEGYKKTPQKNSNKIGKELNDGVKFDSASNRYLQSNDLDMFSSKKNHTTSSKLLKSMTRSKKFESTHLECSSTPQLYKPRLYDQYSAHGNKISNKKLLIPCSRKSPRSSQKEVYSFSEDLADVGTYEEFVAGRENNESSNGDRTLFENVAVGTYEEFERELLDKDQKRLRGLIYSMFFSGNIVTDER